MTRREKLLRAIRTHIIKELLVHADLSVTQIEKRMRAIEGINKRLPHLTKPPPRISSQRKLFY